MIVSSKSSPSVLKPEGFLLWATALNFGVSCLGQGDSSSFMYANLGREDRNVRQGSASGNNGVLRYNYGLASVGTCRETFQGGNHFRWFIQNTKQAGTAVFLAASLEASLANAHTVQPNGYNLGRDQLVGNATQPNGISWGGHAYNATVEWIDAGILLNATSEGINHPEIAPPNGTAVDGRIAVLYVNAWLSDEGPPYVLASLLPCSPVQEFIRYTRTPSDRVPRSRRTRRLHGGHNPCTSITSDGRPPVCSTYASSNYQLLL